MPGLDRILEANFSPGSLDLFLWCSFPSYSVGATSSPMWGFAILFYSSVFLYIPIYFHLLSPHSIYLIFFKNIFIFMIHYLILISWSKLSSPFFVCYWTVTFSSVLLHWFFLSFFRQKMDHVKFTQITVFQVAFLAFLLFFELPMFSALSGTLLSNPPPGYTSVFHLIVSFLITSPFASNFCSPPPFFYNFTNSYHHWTNHIR